MQRGVAPAAAQKTVKQFPAERIQAQLEVFDYLVAQKDAKVSRNPPGFLVSAIQGDFVPPKSYVDRESERLRKQKGEEQQRQAVERWQRLEAAEREKEEAQQAAIRQFWDSWSTEERAQLEDEALKCATVMQRKMLQGGSTLSQNTRQLLLNSYALKLMRQGI